MAEEIKFEKAIERLEKIVTDLEAGNISLEDALKKYEEGIHLSRACQKKLSEAEKKVEILTRAAGGQLKAEPFDLEAAEDAEPRDRVREKKKSQKKREDDAGDADDGDVLI